MSIHRESILSQFACYPCFNSFHALGSFSSLRPAILLSLMSLCLPATATLAPAPVAAPVTAQTATHACRLPAFPQEVQCGQIQRPLNPAQPDGKKISIHFAVLPSQDRNKLADAVFLLAGGPGQSAISVAGFGQAVLSRLNRRRDLVFVDQRGTGRSAALHCPELEDGGDIVDNDSMQKMTHSCMTKLQTLAYGDLQYFSTSIAVQDLEAVRLAQGYSAINLVGASYGTRAGLEYLRQFPQSVRRLVLDGVTPPTMRLPAADAQAALDGVFAACAKDARCQQAYPDLAARWAHLLNSMPQQISVLHPRLGNPLSLPMSRDALLGLVHKTLYSATTTAALPYALSQAAQGKFAALLTLSGNFALPGPAGIAYGMHFSVWCGEAYAPSFPLAATPPRDEFERMASDMYGKACQQWPRAQIPAGFFTLPVSRAPVLLLSGGIDPVTPSRHAAAVAQALGNKARHIHIDNAGHGLLTHGCVRDVVYRYINASDDAGAIAVDADCVRQIPRPLAWLAPLATLSPASPAAPIALIQNGAKP
ncbi:alpha/beta fold hydrolase [soil metagenome]